MNVKNQLLLILMMISSASWAKDYTYSNTPLISLNFDTDSIKQLDAVIDAIGNLAMSQNSLLSISAPQTMEIALLKPILAGRQNVIKVQFVAHNTSHVELKLFSLATLNKEHRD